MPSITRTDLENLLKSIGLTRADLKPAATIFVENGLDQDVTVQVKGNREKSTSGAINVGSSFTVSANSNDARTLTPDTSGWLPYITVTAKCSTAPSTGKLTVWLVRAREDQVKLMELEIRDTEEHWGEWAEW